MLRANSLEKTLRLGTIEERRRREQEKRGWDSWMASLTQWTWVWTSSRRWWRTGEPGVHGVAKSRTRLSNWTTITMRSSASQANKIERMNSNKKVCRMGQIVGKGRDKGTYWLLTIENFRRKVDKSESCWENGWAMREDFRMLSDASSWSYISRHQYFSLDLLFWPWSLFFSIIADENVISFWTDKT